MLHLLKTFFSKTLAGRGRSPDSARVLARREELISLSLKGFDGLPAVDEPFKLSWSIAHDTDFEEILLYEFTTSSGECLHRELASFGDRSRAQLLIDWMLAKYATRILQIRLAPGVGVYASGNNSSSFDALLKHLCAQGFTCQQNDLTLLKRDGATREIFEPETILERTPTA
ncbi:MAG TPA: hypothetical protein V6C89_14225 [Drouetiella sp.]|jgi:hypothetical protein